MYLDGRDDHRLRTYASFIDMPISHVLPFTHPGFSRCHQRLRDERYT